MVLGTPHYMSAEQAKGMPADQRSDIYALGVILYEMLVGKVPFDDKSIPSILVKHLTEPPRPPSSLRGDIPKEVETLVLRCLEKDPDKRFQSADELGRALAVREETVPHRALDPTLATVPSHEQATVASSPGLTGAGGAAATAKPVPFPPPVPAVEPTGRMESGTLRAREVPTAPPRPAPAKPQGGSRTGLFLGLAVIGFLLLVMAGGGFLLLRLLRGGAAEETTEVATASTGALEIPATPSEEPPANEAPPPAETEPPGDTPLVSEASSDEPSPPQRELPPPSPPARTAQEESRTAQTQPPPPRPTSSIPAQAAPPAEEPLPEKPTVSVECDGVRDACGEIRTALQQALERKGMRSGRAPASDIQVLVAAEEIEARTEEQFGNTFVIRTYSVTLDAEAPRFGDSVTFPPRTFSFDARLGREKLRGEAHVIATSAAERIEKYWQTKLEGR
jgi:hypothetical protein